MIMTVRQCEKSFVGEAAPKDVSGAVCGISFEDLLGAVGIAENAQVAGQGGTNAKPEMLGEQDGTNAKLEETGRQSGTNAKPAEIREAGTKVGIYRPKKREEFVLKEVFEGESDKAKECRNIEEGMDQSVIFPVLLQTSDPIYRSVPPSEEGVNLLDCAVDAPFQSVISSGDGSGFYTNAFTGCRTDDAQFQADSAMQGIELLQGMEYGKQNSVPVLQNGTEEKHQEEQYEQVQPDTGAFRQRMQEVFTGGNNKMEIAIAGEENKEEQMGFAETFDRQTKKIFLSGNAADKTGASAVEGENTGRKNAIKAGFDGAGITPGKETVQREAASGFYDVKAEKNPNSTPDLSSGKENYFNAIVGSDDVFDEEKAEDIAQRKQDLQSGESLFSERPYKADTASVSFKEKADVIQHPVYKQVADSVIKGIREERVSFDMKLYPEGLGKVNVRLVCERGSVSLEIHAYTKEAGELISAQIGNLKSALSQNNYDVTKAHVSFGTGGEASDGGKSFGTGSGWADPGASKGGSSEKTVWQPVSLAKEEYSEPMRPYVLRAGLLSCTV